MGTFIKDNISDIYIGSKSSNVSGKTVQSSNINISNIERGSSEFTSNSNISSSVDFGDLFNDKAQASEVSSASMTNGSTNIDGTNQSSSSVSQHGMSNDKVNENSTNQQTGNAQSASLSNGKNEENNTSQATGRASSQGATSGGNQGSSTGQTGGSATGASSSSGKGPSGTTGGTGGKASTSSMSVGNTGTSQGSNGGHKAVGVEVKSSTVQSATRPTALNSGGTTAQTGTTVSQKTVTASEVETNALKAEANTGGIIGKAVRWFVKEVIDVIETVKSTEVVIATSVLSAVGNIVEAVVIDGFVGYVVAGVLDLCGADDFANELRMFAARDQVGEINKWFYEETDMGRHINEMSAIKYDSAIAKGITTLTETAIKIAVATGIAALPGGMFILAGIGALEGMGNAAESAYQNALANGETDLTLSVLSNVGILGSGALNAAAWIFNAKLGQGFLSIAGDVEKIGLKETALTFGKQLFSKETISNILKPSNFLMNAGQSTMQSGGEIGKVFSKFMNGEKIKPEDWWNLTRTFGTYLLLNIAEDVLTDSVSDYSKVDVLKKLDTEAPEKIKEPEAKTNDIKEKVLAEEDSLEPTIELKKQEDIDLEPKHELKETDQVDIEVAKKIEAEALEPYEFKCTFCGADEVVYPKELSIHRCTHCGRAKEVERVISDFPPEKQKKFKEASKKYEDLLEQQGNKPVKTYQISCPFCRSDDFVSPHELSIHKCKTCGGTQEVDKIIRFELNPHRKQDFIDEMEEYERHLREQGIKPLKKYIYRCSSCGERGFVTPHDLDYKKCTSCGQIEDMDEIIEGINENRRQEFIDEMEEYEDKLIEAGKRPIPSFKYVCQDCGGEGYVSPTAKELQKCEYCGKVTPVDIIKSYLSTKKRKQFEHFKELDIKQKEILKSKKE